jgi:hypothetical protein
MQDQTEFLVIRVESRSTSLRKREGSSCSSYLFMLLANEEEDGIIACGFNALKLEERLLLLLQPRERREQERNGFLPHAL